MDKLVGVGLGTSCFTNNTRSNISLLAEEGFPEGIALIRIKLALKIMAPTAFT